MLALFGHVIISNFIHLFAGVCMQDFLVIKKNQLNVTVYTVIYYT